MVRNDTNELLAFHGFPPGTGEAGSAAAATCAVVFKVVGSAQQRWRAVNAPRLVAFVRAGPDANADPGRGTETPAA